MPFGAGDDIQGMGDDGGIAKGCYWQHYGVPGGGTIA
jgi:hypothetical protein